MENNSSIEHSDASIVDGSDTIKLVNKYESQEKNSTLVYFDSTDDLDISLPTSVEYDASHDATLSYNGVDILKNMKLRPIALDSEASLVHSTATTDELTAHTAGVYPSVGDSQKLGFVVPGSKFIFRKLVNVTASTAEMDSNHYFWVEGNTYDEENDTNKNKTITSFKTALSNLEENRYIRNNEFKLVPVVDASDD